MNARCNSKDTKIAEAGIVLADAMANFKFWNAAAHKVSVGKLNIHTWQSKSMDSMVYGCYGLWVLWCYICYNYYISIIR